MSVIRNAVAIVTGATGGIGEALCIALSRNGARLVPVARNAEALAVLREKLIALGSTVSTYQVDLSSRAEVKALREHVLKEFSRIDILINNAAVGLFQTIADSKEDDIATVLSTNLLGTIHCIQEVVPVMRQQQQGHIVNVSSVVGRHAIYHQGIYSASKAAVDRISEALLSEELKHGIRVSLILPDRTETNFLAHALGPKELIAMPGGDLRKLSAAQVADGIIKAIENDEVVHYSSWRGRVFAALSAACPSLLRYLVRWRDE